MGRKSSIDEATAKQLIAASGAGKSRREMAAAYGLSIGSVNRFFESLPKAAAAEVVLPTHQHAVGSAPRAPLVDVAAASLWDTKAALEANYQRIIALADKLDAGITVQSGDYVTLTPPATNVAAIKEIREHVKTSMDLMKLLVDVDEVRKFQQAVIEAIREADEPTQRRIIAKLREQRSVGLALF